MIYDKSVIGNHPAKDGYRLEFFVQSEDYLNFQSGSGSFDVTFPEFSITGAAFEGKELAQLPTGEGLQLIEDFNILTETINLKCFFSGDLDGQSKLATRNIKELAIFTGSSVFFDADFLNETNLISRSLTQVDENTEFFTFSVKKDDIQGRVEELIYYKVLPLDFLTFGNVSEAVSGIMFSGFQDTPIVNTPEYIINRQNIRDIELSEAGIIDIFTGSNLIIEDGLVLDVDIDFRIRTNTEQITISGANGAVLTSSSSNFPVVNNHITIGTGNNLAEFNISSLLDVNGNRESFIVSEL